MRLPAPSPEIMPALLYFSKHCGTLPDRMRTHTQVFLVSVPHANTTISLPLPLNNHPSFDVQQQTQRQTKQGLQIVGNIRNVCLKQGVEHYEDVKITSKESIKPRSNFFSSLQLVVGSEQ